METTATRIYSTYTLDTYALHICRGGRILAANINMMTLNEVTKAEAIQIIKSDYYYGCENSLSELIEIIESVNSNFVRMV